MTPMVQITNKLNGACVSYPCVSNVQMQKTHVATNHACTHV